jgi:hypothetical protein
MRKEARDEVFTPEKIGELFFLKRMEMRGPDLLPAWGKEQARDDMLPDRKILPA